MVIPEVLLKFRCASHRNSLANIVNKGVPAGQVISGIDIDAVLVLYNLIAMNLVLSCIEQDKAVTVANDPVQRDCISNAESTVVGTHIHSTLRIPLDCVTDYGYIVDTSG